MIVSGTPERNKKFCFPVKLLLLQCANSDKTQQHPTQKITCITQQHTLRQTKVFPLFTLTAAAWNADLQHHVTDHWVSDNSQQAYQSILQV